MIAFPFGTIRILLLPSDLCNFTEFFVFHKLLQNVIVAYKPVYHLLITCKYANFHLTLISFQLFASCH